MGSKTVVTSIALNWFKNGNKYWCKLFELDLSSLEGYGVYVIWHGGFPSRIVKVGHGQLAAELEASRGEERVRYYLQDGVLFVTWAIVDASVASGIHRHLADSLRPLIADPDVYRSAPLAANSPF